MIEIPGYRIERELGHGGMATVYLAVQESLGRSVAMKVMAPALAADRSFTERFEREAHTVAHLSHPHIVSVYDVGVSGHYHYLVLEYVNGGDLKARVRGTGALAPDEALRITKQIALALGYARQQGFVHRDVKPENVLFRQDGTAVLTDFGIAKAVGSGAQMTGTGMSIGTPHYMSPEQARGHEVDERSDLYGVGIMLYEMLTGQVPYEAEDPLAIGIKHIQDPVPELPEQLSHIQPVLDRLLAKGPEDRYPGAAELIQALDRITAGQVMERPAHATAVMSAVDQPRAEPAKASSGLAWGIGGAVAAGALGIGFYLWQQSPQAIPHPGGGTAAVQIARTGPSVNAQPVAVSPKPLPSSQSTREIPAVLQMNDPAHPRQEIAQLLAAAAEDIKAHRLTSPAGNNAYEKYRRVLNLSPANATALRGLKTMFERYVKLLRQAAQAGEARKFTSLVTRGKPIVIRLLKSIPADQIKRRHKEVDRLLSPVGNTFYTVVDQADLQDALPLFEALREYVLDVSAVPFVQKILFKASRTTSMSGFRAYVKKRYLKYKFALYVKFLRQAARAGEIRKFTSLITRVRPIAIRVLKSLPADQINRRHNGVNELFFPWGTWDQLVDMIKTASSQPNRKDALAMVEALREYLLDVSAVPVAQKRLLEMTGTTSMSGFRAYVTEHLFKAKVQIAAASAPVASASAPTQPAAELAKVGPVSKQPGVAPEQNGKSRPSVANGNNRNMDNYFHTLANDIKRDIAHGRLGVAYRKLKTLQNIAADKAERLRASDLTKELQGKL